MLKFKSREELLKKKLRIMDECSDSDRDGSWNNGISIGINDAFESFAERVEFYKKYIVSTKNIKINHLIGGMYSIDLWDNFPDLVKQYLKQDEKDYNEWLFDYCFRDM